MSDLLYRYTVYENVSCEHGYTSIKASADEARRTGDSLHGRSAVVEKPYIPPVTETRFVFVHDSPLHGLSAAVEKPFKPKNM